MCNSVFGLFLAYIAAGQFNFLHCSPVYVFFVLDLFFRYFSLTQNRFLCYLPKVSIAIYFLFFLHPKVVNRLPKQISRIFFISQYACIWISLFYLPLVLWACKSLKKISCSHNRNKLCRNIDRKALVQRVVVFVFLLTISGHWNKVIIIINELLYFNFGVGNIMFETFCRLRAIVYIRSQARAKN